MRKILCYVAAATMLITLVNTACRQPGGSDAKRAEAAAAAAQDRDAKAVAIIKDFYTAYMYQFAASSSGPANQEKLDSIASQYCSGDLISEIHKTELEADPFIHAQDCDSAWVKTLQVIKDSVKQNTYNISYRAGGGSNIVIHAQLSQGDDGVLIEKIY
jgi:hypothetical protein